MIDLIGYVVDWFGQILDMINTRLWLPLHINGTGSISLGGVFIILFGFSMCFKVFNMLLKKGNETKANGKD